jgi:hypothetical protein
MNRSIIAGQMSDDFIYVRQSLVKALGGLSVASLFSQIVYWHSPTKSGASKLRVQRDGQMWVAKTREDWMAECGLTEWTFRSSVKKLKDLGVVETVVKKFAGNPTIHLRLIEGRLSELLGEKTSNLVVMKPPVSCGGNLKIVLEDSSKTYTETTTETTTDVKTGNAPLAEKQEIPVKTAEEILKNKQEAAKAKTGDPEKQSLSVLWRQKLADNGAKFIVPLGMKDLGMLKRFDKDLGHDLAIKAMGFAFDKWVQFANRVKAAEGLTSVPASPTLWFMHKYRSLLGEMTLQSIAAKPVQPPPLDDYTPPWAASTPKADEPYIPTAEELAATLKKLGF